MREVIKEETAPGLCLKLEGLYLTKSLINKLRFKEMLCTLKMVEGMLTKSHLDDFNYILVDLKNLEVNIGDEDKAILLVCSLPHS